MSGDGCAERISPNCIFQADAFLGDKAFGRIAFCGLASECVLHTFPWIQRDDRPVTAEGQYAPGILDAAKCPAALSAFRTNIPSPNLQRIFMGIGVQWLETGDHSQL